MPLPPAKPSKLIQRFVENLGLEMDKPGYVKTDEMQETNVKGLFAAGDVQGVPREEHLRRLIMAGWQLAQ